MIPTLKKNLPKVLCIVPSIGHPHSTVYVEMICQAGFEIEVLGFNRGYPGSIPARKIESLGRLTHRNYLNRILKMVSCIPKVRAAIRRNELIYVFNLDLALMALTAGIGMSKPLVLDVPDILKLQVVVGPVGRLVRAVERRVITAAGLLVLHSSQYRVYYRDWLKTKTPDTVIENKMSPSVAASIPDKHLEVPAGRPLEDRPLVIGYFGFLRDIWCLQLIERLASDAPKNIRFIAAGIPGLLVRDCMARLGRTCNLDYRGHYDLRDLSNILAEVDIVLACYPPEIPSGWSRSCRYYTAGLLHRPLIVRAGTADADEVQRHDIGLIVKDTAVEGAAAAIRSITHSDWQRWRENIKKLPRKNFVYDVEYDDLRQVLCQVVAEG